MEKSIIKKIKKNIKNYKNFLIGFSGGIDSTVLLYIMYKLKKKNNFNIRVIHINHNIHTKCKIWEKHCIKICNKLKIKLIIKNIILNNKFSNLESELRKNRYRLYNENIIKNEILLTAHHLNDQCETILLALKRGSGLKGITGINKIMKFKNKIFIRPLLNISKKDINKYALKHNLKWINDPNNKNINLDRNYLRIKIIPKLLNRWPFFLKTINRSSEICFNQENLIKNLLKNKFNYVLEKNNSLNIIKINKLSKEEKIFILRKWINLNNHKMISFKLINLLCSFIKKEQNNFQLSLGKYFIKIYNKHIFLIENYKIINPKIFLWNKEKKYFILPNKIGFLYIKKKTKKNLVRKPYKNELIYIKFQTNDLIKRKGKIKKKIKKIFKEIKVNPWERKNTPVIYYNDNPIISPNLFITEKSIPKNKEYWSINFKKFSFKFFN